MIILNNRLMKQPPPPQKKRINAKFQSFVQQILPRGNGEQSLLIPGGHIFWQC